MKDTSKAVEQARRIIEKYPSSARGYMVLATVYESQKDYPRAIAEAKNGVRVEVNNLKAIMYLGHLFEVSKDYSQAMAQYTDALRKKSDFVPAIFAQGALLDVTGKKKEAIAKYRMALEKDENHVPSLNNLAYLLADGYGSKEEALRLAIAAYKHDPTNAGILDTLGFALLKHNRPEDARKVLDKAVTAMPNNPAVHYHLALAHKGTGNKAAAQNSVKKALSLGEFSEAAAARQLAAELGK